MYCLQQIGERLTLHPEPATHLSPKTGILRYLAGTWTRGDPSHLTSRYILMHMLDDRRWGKKLNSNPNMLPFPRRHEILCWPRSSHHELELAWRKFNPNQKGTKRLMRWRLFQRNRIRAGLKGGS